MPQKFIINDGKLLLGDVQYHTSLARDHSKTKGGGWWHIVAATKTLLLYGSSTEFGHCNYEDVQMSQKPVGLDLNIIFTHEWPLSRALEYADRHMKISQLQNQTT